jgi:hypothetical protein
LDTFDQQQDAEPKTDYTDAGHDAADDASASANRINAIRPDELGARSLIALLATRDHVCRQIMSRRVTRHYDE